MEDAMCRAEACRDVLLMDVHGVVFTAATADKPRVPLIGQWRHEKWVVTVREVLDRAGVFPPQIKEALLEPQTLWDLRMSLEINTPRTSQGRVIRESEFHERVNLRLLRAVALPFMQSLTHQQQRYLARQVKRGRRNASRYQYFLEDEMRQLVQDLSDTWMLHLTTAGGEMEVEREFRSENVPLDLFARVFLTEKVGLPKSHPDFWRSLAVKLGVDPQRCVVVEDNLMMGLNAAEAGMSVVFYDRGYGLEDFIHRELQGRVCNIRLSCVGDDLPCHQPFVVCAGNVGEIQRCLNLARAAKVGDP